MRAVALALAVAVAGAPVVAHADADDAFDPATSSLQIAGGSVAAVLGGLAVGGAAFGISAQLSRGMTPIVMAALGGVVGGSAGLVVGTKLVGDWRDGSGDWLGTTAGFGAGLLAAGAVNFILDEYEPTVSPAVRVGIGAVLLGIGPTIGYQLTNGGAAPPATMFALPSLAF